MCAAKDTLNHIIHISPAGIKHPYYTRQETEQVEAMIASVTSYPPLGHETVVAADEKLVWFRR